MAKKKRKTAKKKTAAKKSKKTATKKKTAKKATKKKTSKKKATKKKAGKKKTAQKAAKPVKAAKPTGPIPPSKPILATPKNQRTAQLSQSELYESIMGSCGFRNKREAKEFYLMFASMLQGALKKGYKVPLPGLGKLQVRRTKARMGRNPMTQEAIKIPARKKVAFTANKALKDAVL